MMSRQKYLLKCEMEVASISIAREFGFDYYKKKHRVVAAKEREESKSVVWRLRHIGPDYLLGSLECILGPEGTTILFVEDPPMTNWQPVSLEEVDGDIDRMIELSQQRREEAEARDVSKRSIQVLVIEDLLNELEVEYHISVSEPHAERVQSALWDWAGNPSATLPWERVVSLSLGDVEAACHEHLERLAGKRFPADWDVQVTPYDERAGIAIRYDIQSNGRMVGHLRIRRVNEKRTQLEVTVRQYGNEADEIRLREIMVVFAGRWLEELRAEVEPPMLRPGLASAAGVGTGDLSFVNLNSTAGNMSPGLYPAKPSQARAIELANAAISNLNDQFREEATSQPAATLAEDEKSLPPYDQQSREGGNGDLTKPFKLSWPVSRLKRWFQDFSDDNNMHLCILLSPEKGDLDICKDPFTYVGIKCEPQADGQMLLTPYVLNEATNEAIAELRQWRKALEAAAGQDASISVVQQETLNASPGIQKSEREPITTLARRLNRHPKRIARWYRILDGYFPQGFTQGEIAAEEDKDIETIKDDYRDMKAAGLFPPASHP